MLKKITKKILSSSVGQSIIANLLYFYIKLIAISGRWEKINLDFIRSLWRENKPYIGISWHGRILMLFPAGWEGSKNNRLKAVFSAHRDGKLVAKLLEKMGADCIFGSSTRGGVSASKAVIKALEEGSGVAITPDGPRGPRMKMKRSVIFFAKLTGVPIVPVTMSAKSCKIFNSWDRFILPHPFTKGVFIAGQEMYVPKDASEEEMEDLRIKLEKELNRICFKADEMVGIEPIVPQEEAK